MADDKPATPIVLTNDDVDAFFKSVTPAGEELSCEVCRTANWLVFDLNKTSTVVFSGGRFVGSDAVVLECKKCGNTKEFSRRPMDSFVASEKGARDV